MDDPDASNIRLTPEYDENGVDLTVVRQMLTLTPAERLQYVEERNRAVVEILRALSESEVQFIVVCGIATLLHGGSTATQDLDVVVSSEPRHIGPITAALEVLDAVWCSHPQRPTWSHLAAIGNLSLTTRLGRLTLHATIGLNLDYKDLLPHTVEMDIHGDFRVRVLDQETNTAINEQMGWDPDLAVLHIMRATLKEQRRRPH